MVQLLYRRIALDGAEHGHRRYQLAAFPSPRRILKRMRRAMESVKPGCLIDLHSNTGFSRGPANQYTEFFPYVDKLWFGESFLYDKMTPANWLVESSGIPFGLSGDMLYRGGNAWLGMQYGMTAVIHGTPKESTAIRARYGRYGIHSALRKPPCSGSGKNIRL